MSNLRIDNIAPSAGGTYRNAPRGIAAAWVNFNGTSTVAIRDSENVASLTDAATGVYRVNLLSSMSDANYCYVTSAGFNSASSNGVNSTMSNVVAMSSSLFGVRVDIGASDTDVTLITASAHGDLA